MGGFFTALKKDNKQDQWAYVLQISHSVHFDWGESIKNLTSCPDVRAKKEDTVGNLKKQEIPGSATVLSGLANAGMAVLIFGEFLNLD